MTRQLFTITFVVLAVAACCFAQSTINVRPVTQTDCSGSGLTWVSEFASNYSTTPTVPTSICIFNDFETACPTLTGVVPCDRRAFTCHEWRGTNAWNAENVLRQWTATTAPSECLQFGTLDFHPDTSVVIVLQPLTSMLVFIGLAISAIVNFRSRVNWFSILIVVSMCIIGILQTVSYHYLNAYIVIAAGMIALAGYSRATPVSIGFGMFILLGAFYWVTFDTGLGHLQHHSRLLAGPSIADTYEIKCNTYYSGFFSIPRVLMKDTDNVQNQFFGYCNRAFLAAQLFLMIIQEYLLILLIAMGAFAITEPKAPANQAESEEATEAF